MAIQTPNNIAGRTQTLRNAAAQASITPPLVADLIEDAFDTAMDAATNGGGGGGTVPAPLAVPRTLTPPSLNIDGTLDITSQGQPFFVLLGATNTLSFSSIVPGAAFTIEVRQDAIGSRSLQYPAGNTVTVIDGHLLDKTPNSSSYITGLMGYNGMVLLRISSKNTKTTPTAPPVKVTGDVTDIGPGPAYTLDFDGNSVVPMQVFKINLTQNSTFGIDSYENGRGFIIDITQPASGGKTLTFVNNGIPIIITGGSINMAPNSKSTIWGYIDESYNAVCFITGNQAGAGQTTPIQLSAPNLAIDMAADVKTPGAFFSVFLNQNSTLAINNRVAGSFVIEVSQPQSGGFDITFPFGAYVLGGTINKAPNARTLLRGYCTGSNLTIVIDTAAAGSQAGPAGQVITPTLYVPTNTTLFSIDVGAITNTYQPYHLPLAVSPNQVLDLTNVQPYRSFVIEVKQPAPGGQILGWPAGAVIKDANRFNTAPNASTYVRGMVSAAGVPFLEVVSNVTPTALPPSSIALQGNGIVNLTANNAFYHINPLDAPVSIEVKALAPLSTFYLDVRQDAAGGKGISFPAGTVVRTTQNIIDQRPNKRSVITGFMGYDRTLFIDITAEQ